MSSCIWEVDGSWHLFCTYYVCGKSLYSRIRWSESQSWLCFFLAIWLRVSRFLYAPQFPYLWKEDNNGLYSMVLQGFSEILCIKCLEQCYHFLNPDNTPMKKLSFFKGMNRLRKGKWFAQSHTASWGGAVFLPLCVGFWSVRNMLWED